ncbi:hypothetical protein L6452_36157 [Arctium lappa]|uniref:Uncharacterized protein n=1 Tax=Arctium lappa TaxID=4217 RepID=A0ACB8Y8L2_ARCLA|nr:hypothetical protein L6452_36157 [Arctium lappa]
MANWGENLHDKEHDVHRNVATQGDTSNLYVPDNTSKFVTNKVFHSREDLIEWDLKQFCFIIEVFLII